MADAIDTMTGGIAPALAASWLAAVFAAVGVFATARNRAWAERRGGDFAGFASGLLLTIAVLHLIPEGLAMHRFAPWLIMAGYLVLYFTNRAFPPASGGAAAAAPVVGIAFHSFVDGLEYPILFANDLYTGVMASAGLIAHEVAEGVLVFALLQRAGVGARLAVAAALVVAALTTPLGAYLSMRVVDDVAPETVGALMSLAAGALLYVGASHLPRFAVGDAGDARLGVFFIAGVALGGAMSAAHTLNHDHAAPHANAPDRVEDVRRHHHRGDDHDHDHDSDRHGPQEHD
ncbi:MAG: ZIP family metal transporter [Pseudomonadota bacterium]